jgi:predicted unusual protein kinase regulating ubiquinone biosynthesis (AarF/ABC1/UbiB family)
VCNTLRLQLAILLDKFDPKSDGADRDWVSIYEESERLLYLEIDYLNEVRNAERFAKDFEDIDWVRVPKVYHEVTTPRVLTMEFVESFKLTDTKRIAKEGLDRQLLSKRVAESFLRQIVETAYFHAEYVSNIWFIYPFSLKGSHIDDFCPLQPTQR